MAFWLVPSAGPTVVPGACSGCGAMLGEKQWAWGDCVQAPLAPLAAMAWLDRWRCGCGLATEMCTLIATGNDALLDAGPGGEVYWGDVADLDDVGEVSEVFTAPRDDGLCWSVERYVFNDFHGSGLTVFDVHRLVAPVLASGSGADGWAREISADAITLCRAATAMSVPPAVLVVEW